MACPPSAALERARSAQSPDANELSDAVVCEDVAGGMAAARARTGKADIIVAFGSFQQVQLVRELVFPQERGTA